MTHNLSRGAIATAVVLVIGTLALYTRGLAQAPPYLMHDELQFSLQARSIAETGRDLAGRRFPVFFTEPEFPAGRDPALIYITAAFLKVLPFSQANVKVPTATIGALNVALIFVAAWWLTGQPWLGVLAAFFLAVTPIHFIRSRLVLSPFSSVPFLLGWLIALAHYLRSGSRRALLSGTACVAMTVYTYLACTVMAPVYLAITAVIAVRKEGKAVIVPMIVTAAIVVLPVLAWYATHPERYAQLVEAYRLYGSGASNAVPSPVLAPGTPEGPRLWLSLIWQFFDPNFLFVSGDSSLINSTRTAGLFPVGLAVFIVAGIWSAARSRDVSGLLVLVGFVTSPLASLLSGAIEMNRIMFVIPFGVLLATLGARAMFGGTRVMRVVAAVLVAGAAYQFAGFHRTYIRDYPAQAGKWFGGNVRDAVIELSKGEGPVYFGADTPFAYRYWSFYVPAEQRGRALNVFRDAPASDAPPGARAACGVSGGACVRLLADPRWRRVATVPDVSGDDAFLVFERR